METDVDKTPVPKPTVAVAAEEEEDVVMEIQETWTQSAAAPTINFNNRLSVQADANKTPVNKPRSQIKPDFHAMNVKEKVHAYEEIILISPCNTQSHKKNSRSPVCRKSVPKTPENTCVAQTPETVVNCKTISVTSDEQSQDNHKRRHSSTCESDNVPVKSAKKDTPRLSAPRASMRKSHRKSLHALPSSKKISTGPKEVC